MCRLGTTNSEVVFAVLSEWIIVNRNSPFVRFAWTEALKRLSIITQGHINQTKIKTNMRNLSNKTEIRQQKRTAVQPRWAFNQSQCIMFYYIPIARVRSNTFVLTPTACNKI